MLSNLSYQLKLGCYKIFYVSFTVTTKEKPVVDMQKVMIKESKHTTTKGIKSQRKTARKTETKDI